uniref:Uncharacterized protein n=1 Tax=Triticum urartu TaxID=4572 RepID=A0A8R7PUV4_TRIUA
MPLRETKLSFYSVASPGTALPRSLAAWGRKILLSNRKFLEECHRSGSSGPNSMAIQSTTAVSSRNVWSSWT